MRDKKNNVRLMIGGAEDGPTLICFCCAGGAAGMYRPLLKWLPDNVRLLAVDPPGHGLNSGQPLRSVDRMLEVYAEALEGEITKPYAILGHSFGGVVAWMMAQEVLTEPLATFVCALKPPPQLIDRRYSTLDDGTLFDMLSAIGGVPAAFIENRSAFAPYLPSARADFLALEDFDAHRMQPVSHPIRIAGSREDRLVDHETLLGWREFSTQCEVQEFDGGHFFLQDTPRPFAEWVATSFNER